MKKTYYYSDEINDDFAGTNIKRKELPADYPYFSSNPVRKFFEFILYRLIVTPLIFLFQKIVFREKFKNKKVLKKYRKNGYFIYANHTSAVSDADLGHLPQKGIYSHQSGRRFHSRGRQSGGDAGRRSAPHAPPRHEKFSRRRAQSCAKKTLYRHLSRSAYLALLYEDTPL